jgi:hypothetical protein
VKFPATNEQAHVEVAAAKLYGHVGIPTLNPSIENHGGKTAVKTDWNPDVSNHSEAGLVSAAQHPTHSHTMALAHHMAVITNNRDILGLVADNMMKHKNGSVLSADQGSSFDYRAQGEKKPFNNDISEIHNGFQNPKYLPTRVFGKIHPSVMKSAAQHIKNTLSDDVIHSALSQHGLEKHADTIKARRDSLVKSYT